MKDGVHGAVEGDHVQLQPLNPLPTLQVGVPAGSVERIRDLSSMASDVDQGLQEKVKVGQTRQKEEEEGTTRRDDSPAKGEELSAVPPLEGSEAHSPPR